ncbi:MAG: hypothetical protein SWH61_10025 [Thermodesulfobacteriota bacterium]|nr:hypothetical protein [Thermodesulfobacteriota bacterium]
MKADPQEVRDIIEEAITTTFSTMVFSEVFPCDPDPSYFSAAATAPEAATPSERAILSAGLEMTKPFKLNLQLTLLTDQAVLVTTNLLGGEADSTPPVAHIQDAIGELLNTIAGIMAQHFTPEGETFEISLPAISQAPPPSEDNQTVVSYFLQDDTYIFTMAVWGDAL